MNLAIACRRCALISMCLLLTSCGNREWGDTTQASHHENGPSGAVRESSHLDDETDLTAEERATLSSLRKVHDYPLYVMTYQHDYETVVAQADSSEMTAGFACSLFAAFDGPDGAIMGRNFDWNESPALLLFTHPEDGYKSVSMVDISYLGYNQFNLDDLEDVEGRRRLLRAPLIPFDGMNDQGLVVAMAAVPAATIPKFKGKPTIISVTLMRLMLDQAKTVDEAIELVDDYNIDFAGGPNIHYLVADRHGKSALIELKNDKVNIHRNTGPWQIATNFYLTGVIGEPEDACNRYANLSERLKASEGRLSISEAMEALQQVAQPSTRWSMVYGMDAMEAQLILNRDFDSPYIVSLKEQTIQRREMTSTASN